MRVQGFPARVGPCGVVLLLEGPAWGGGMALSRALEGGWAQAPGGVGKLCHH